MKQQLYINGVRVDMTGEVKIKVESNFFSDVGKIMTAHSYTLSLPRTALNDAVFRLAYLPQGGTEGVTTHTYLNAALWVDGVPLFEDGKAVLTSVDDKGYNLTLFWGLLGIFDEIKREDLNLCDLSLSEYWNEGTMATWVQLHRFNGQLGTQMLVASYRSGMDADVYTTLDDEGKALADRLPWTSPYVGGGTILDKIATVYGVTFDKSAQFQTRLASLYFPLTSLRAMADGETVTGSLVGGTYDYKPDSNQNHWRHFINWMSDTSSNGYIFDGMLRYGQSPNDRDPGTASAGWPGTYYVPPGGYVTFDRFRVHGVASRPWRLIIHPEWKDACTGATPVMMNSEEWKIEATETGYGSYTMDVTFKDVTAQDWNLPYPTNDDAGWPWADTPEVTLSADFTISGCSDDIMEIDSFYSIERNYPNMKIIDFIGEVLAHCGAFVVGSVVKPDAVSIMTYDEALSASPAELTSYGLHSVTMSKDGLSQRNEMTHKENEDDGLPYLAAGTFVVDDVTLAATDTYFNSKFKVPRSNLIKQWEMTLNDDGTYAAKWVKAGDYVCGLSGVKLYNTGQDFATIITDYYAGFKRIVDTPKMVELTVRMGVLALAAFDFKRPVYIEQLGRLYVAVRLESEGGDAYKLTLAQIN